MRLFVTSKGKHVYNRHHPMNNRILFFLLLVCLSGSIQAQTIRVLHSGTKTSLRGLSVVDDKVVWVSGSNGMVGKSLDSGNTWKWVRVTGFETRDFRDIEAFDAATAIVIAIGEPAQILKTVNGGETWKLVYENKTPGMFLDAMEFWNDQSGIVIGDPVDGRFFIARTFDEGNSWQEIPFQNRPAAKDGEAFFAASGTNIRRLDRDEACFVSGGKYARFFSRNKPVELPLLQGKESSGAFSVAVQDDKKLKGGNRIVVVGGDYAADAIQEKNCFISKNGGKTWISPAISPHGYRSCVEYISKDKLICCGTSGVDISTDGGMNWNLVSGDGYHVCRKAKDGDAVFLAGANGTISRLILK